LIGNTAIYLFPESVISTTVDSSSCPLTYSYYLKNASGNWILQASNTDPFIAFVTSTGKLTVSTSNHALASTYSIKWKIEDPYSVSSSRYVEEIHELNIISCAGNVLT